MKKEKQMVHFSVFWLRHAAAGVMLFFLLSSCTTIAIVVNTEKGYVLNPKDGRVYQQELDPSDRLYDKVKFKPKAVSKKRGSSRCHD